MTPTKNLSTIALCLILLLTPLTITLTNATTENNYINDNNFLTNISESTLTENGYITNIIINPTTVGIYAQENGYKLDLTINPQGIGGSLKENGYILDLIPEKTFPDISGISGVTITKITTSKTIVGQGYSIIINVTVSNQALNYKTVNLTVYANTTSIATQTIALASGNSTAITSTWNTTGFAKGNYTIKAVADDNNFTDGWVIIAMVGDITGSGGYPDGICDMKDIRYVAKRFGIDPTNTALWDPNADIIEDNFIDMKDIRAVAKRFGQTDP